MGALDLDELNEKKRAEYERRLKEWRETPNYLLPDYSDPDWTNTDPDFAAEVGARMGVFGRQGLRGGKALYLGYPETDNTIANYKGFYAPPSYDVKGFADRSKPILSKSLNYEHSKHPETGIHADTVYAVSEDDATNPDIWAHEFRHRAGITDERENRLWDAFTARTKDEWFRAVESYRKYMYLYKDKEWSIETTNEYLQNKLRDSSVWSWEFLEDEAKAYDENNLGGKPKKKTWFGLGPYEEQSTYQWRKDEWHKRRKHWTLHDNPAYDRYKAEKQENIDRKIQEAQEELDSGISKMYEGVDPMIDPSDMDRVIANGR